MNPLAILKLHNKLHIQCQRSTQIPAYHRGLPCSVERMPDRTGTKITHLILFQNILKHLNKHLNPLSLSPLPILSLLYETLATLLHKFTVDGGCKLYS